MLSPRRGEMKRRGIAARMRGRTVKKVVLAYSGGLDTSVILHWLQETYRCEVVTFTADIGQGEELEPARKKAKLMGVKQIFVDDLREEFVRDFVFPMFRANALYEGQYLLGTSIARPLIAKRQIEIANEVGADAVAHGATGKGNDQVRFELAYYALKPDIKVIAPWREWDLHLAHATLSNTPRSTRSRSPATSAARRRSRSTPTCCTSRPRERSSRTPGSSPRSSSIAAPSRPKRRPTSPSMSRSSFARGDAVAVNGEKLSPAALLARLNELGGKHGIGRLDLVENRFVGMKSRGVYETPGGTILHAAHRGIESITLDRGAAHLKDELMPRYAELIYNGFWFAPEREMLQALDRQEPGERRGHGAPEALQGPCPRRRAQIAEIALQPGARHLRGRRRSTTSATPRASSSSTRCGSLAARKSYRHLQEVALRYLSRMI